MPASCTSWSPTSAPLEQSLGLPPDEIRTWIALHEATHAHEFELHPWVRRYLNSTLQEYLRTMVGELADSTTAIGDRSAGSPAVCWRACVTGKTYSSRS